MRTKLILLVALMTGLVGGCENIALMPRATIDAPDAPSCPRKRSPAKSIRPTTADQADPEDAPTIDDPVLLDDWHLTAQVGGRARSRISATQAPGSSMWRRTAASAAAGSRARSAASTAR